MFELDYSGPSNCSPLPGGCQAVFSMKQFWLPISWVFRLLWRRAVLQYLQDGFAQNQVDHRDQEHSTGGQLWRCSPLREPPTLLYKITMRQCLICLYMMKTRLSTSTLPHSNGPPRPTSPFRAPLQAVTCVDTVHNWATCPAHFILKSSCDRILGKVASLWACLAAFVSHRVTSPPKQGS